MLVVKSHGPDQTLLMPFQPTSRNRSTQALMRLCFALTACLSLLQTPLPMLHQHAGIESQCGLSIHLNLHHLGQPQPADQYHWHFVLPREYASHDSPDQAPPVETGHCCAAGLGDSGSIATVSGFDGSRRSLSPVWDQPIVAQQLACLPGNASRPLSSLTPAVRLCALLCVIRC